jgi:DeoR family suf operon transcriptional repressor
VATRASQARTDTARTDTVRTGIESQPATRRAILVALKKKGEARAEELAAELGITASAVRQQLGGLQGDGLVDFDERRAGPGRPKHAYHLTEAADALFPRTYSELTNELLDYVAAAQPGLVDELFEQRRRRRVECAKERLAGKSFDERVQELAAILDDDGYLAEARRADDGTWQILEHNCAILGVAARYGQACSSEIGFLREALPDADIQRVHHILAGAYLCGYVLTPGGVGRA